MKIYRNVLEDLITESYVIMKFLDFSAAFDTVDHHTLIKRFKTQYGIGEIALNLFKSYLSNRNYKL